jgi:hypothetical protein
MDAEAFEGSLFPELPAPAFRPLARAAAEHVASQYQRRWERAAARNGLTGGPPLEWGQLSPRWRSVMITAMLALLDDGVITVPDDGPALTSRLGVTSRSGEPLTFSAEAAEALAEAGLAVVPAPVLRRYLIGTALETARDPSLGEAQRVLAEAAGLSLGAIAVHVGREARDADAEPVPLPAVADLVSRWRSAAARCRDRAAVAQEPRSRAARQARAEVYDECADALEARDARQGTGQEPPADGPERSVEATGGHGAAPRTPEGSDLPTGAGEGSSR